MAKFYSESVENTQKETTEEFKYVSDFIENSIESINEFFELEKALKWIQENKFKRVALQFPDFYLKWAFQITSFLEERFEGKIYILGDSSYRNCCVDRVTAEHANCDSLIHFGDACLSSSLYENFPIFYLFCKFKLDIEDFKEQMISNPIQKFLKDKDVLNIALLYDSSFSHSSELIKNIIEKDVLTKSKNFISCDVVKNTSNLNHNQSDIALGRSVDKNIKKWVDSATLIFVGLDSSPLLPIWLMTFVQFSNIIYYSPKEKEAKIIKSSSLIRLRKRLFLIEKLRDANTVGLVVGTLAVTGFRETIQRVRQLCKVAQKKLYVFSIGKLNEAKLSNFASDIDVFILLSCPFGVILNTGDYYKPILSLFEAEIALNPSKNWYSGCGWTSQIGDFLNDTIGKFDTTEEIDVSLLLGRIRYKQNQENDDVNKNKEVIQYSAGDYFANRTWKGLDDQYQENTDTILRHGLEGIASGYITEK